MSDHFSLPPLPNSSSRSRFSNSPQPPFYNEWDASSPDPSDEDQDWYQELPEIPSSLDSESDLLLTRDGSFWSPPSSPPRTGVKILHKYAPYATNQIVEDTSTSTTPTFAPALIPAPAPAPAPVPTHAPVPIPSSATISCPTSSVNRTRRTRPASSVEESDDDDDEEYWASVGQPIRKKTTNSRSSVHQLITEQQTLAQKATSTNKKAGWNHPQYQKWAQERLKKLDTLLGKEEKKKMDDLEGWCWTNMSHPCFDCPKVMDLNTRKGCGVGVLVESIYFCETCYVQRHLQDGTPIHFPTELNISIRRKHLTQELIYKKRIEEIDLQREEDLRRSREARLRHRKKHHRSFPRYTPPGNTPPEHQHAEHVPSEQLPPPPGFPSQDIYDVDLDSSSSDSDNEELMALALSMAPISKPIEINVSPDPGELRAGRFHVSTSQVIDRSGTYSVQDWEDLL